MLTQTCHSVYRASERGREMSIFIMLCVLMEEMRGGDIHREGGTLMRRRWNMREGGEKSEVSGHWAVWPQGTSPHNPQTSSDRTCKVGHTHTRSHISIQYTDSQKKVSVKHTHMRSHTFSSLQHLTPAALLLTDIFSPFCFSVSVFLAA